MRWGLSCVVSELERVDVMALRRRVGYRGGGGAVELGSAGSSVIDRMNPGAVWAFPQFPKRVTVYGFKIGRGLLPVDP